MSSKPPSQLNLKYDPSSLATPPSEKRLKSPSSVLGAILVDNRFALFTFSREFVFKPFTFQLLGKLHLDFDDKNFYLKQFPEQLPCLLEQVSLYFSSISKTEWFSDPNPTNDHWLDGCRNLEKL
jgi:hypothetical protein